MARRAQSVIFTKKDPDQLPDVVVEGVALLVTLLERGLLALIAQRVRIRRQGGYPGIDVVIALLLYFASGQQVGMRTLWKRIYPFRKRIAAVAGRKTLPSSSSIHRALEAVTDELLRPIAPWLLSEGAGIDVLLRHGCVRTYDRCGLGWHVFDFDPTVTVLRQRALPAGTDLPCAQRRADALAQPGYGGRKRGDVQVSRATLQHAGSGGWLWGELSAGNGDPHAQLKAALDVVVATCQRLSHPLSCVLFRMDGAFGYVPYYDDCRERAIPFLTRLTRPKLFEQPDVRDTLRQGVWQLVPDSGSGPVRGALELGVVTLPAADGTKRPDGSDYEPLTVRVVVSRYPRSEKAEHGVVIEGWQYELFAMDAPIEAFSAADTVAAYFGRAGQENRFAQEDREAGLDHIFSYHRPGQEFATTIGLWVWNLRLVRGFLLATPPDEPQVQRRACDALDTRTATVPLVEGPPSPAPHNPEPAQQPHVPAAARVTDPLSEALGALEWASLLARRPGWRWQVDEAVLRCPNDRTLVLTTVDLQEGRKERPVLIFCRPAGGCEGCPVRASCLRSVMSQQAKHIKFSVPAAEAHPLKQLLSDRRAQPVRPPASSEPPRRSKRPPFDLTPVSGTPGPLAVHSSVFLPARARNLWREAALELSVRVTLTLPPPRPPRPLLLAIDDASRQHRRKTWTHNVERYALDLDTDVQITFAGPTTLRSILGRPPLQATA